MVLVASANRTIPAHLVQSRFDTSIHHWCRWKKRPRRARGRSSQTRQAQNRRSLLPRLRRLGPRTLLLTTSHPVSFGVRITQGEAPMICLPAPITNSDSAAARRCDRGGFDICARRPPQATFRVLAVALRDDIRSGYALGDHCSIFIGSPLARFAHLSPRIAL